jgi:hypothetical protein
MRSRRLVRSLCCAALCLSTAALAAGPVTLATLPAPGETSRYRLVEQRQDVGQAQIIPVHDQQLGVAEISRRVEPGRRDSVTLRYRLDDVGAEAVVRTGSGGTFNAPATPFLHGSREFTLDLDRKGQVNARFQQDSPLAYYTEVMTMFLEGLPMRPLGIGRTVSSSIRLPVAHLRIEGVEPGSLKGRARSTLLAITEEGDRQVAEVRTEVTGFVSVFAARRNVLGTHDPAGVTIDVRGSITYHVEIGEGRPHVSQANLEYATATGPATWDARPGIGAAWRSTLQLTLEEADE